MRSIRAPASPYSANSSVAAWSSSALVAAASRGRGLRSVVGSDMRFTLSDADDRDQLVHLPRAGDGALDDACAASPRESTAPLNNSIRGAAPSIASGMTGFPFALGTGRVTRPPLRRRRT